MVQRSFGAWQSQSLLILSILVLGLTPWAAVAQSLPDSLVDASPTGPKDASPAGLTDQNRTVRLVVKLKKRRVYVYDGETVIASYPVAIGRSGWETPVGEHQVLNKEVNPVFTSFKTGNKIQPGYDNPLGVRWIGIWTDGKTQIGFHGTNQPESIGQAVSHGCLRMWNKDVTQLFEQVEVGTPVSVQP
ncbi:MAG: L,D-transpeptidase [Myxacorys californica WJT36-NPBG1]|jgi:lipoprotein-anchoring transpeptidase ErfK/SrfK|nr:L,D-transpeptidase [Myxacorys californica WJT36-NPBG1]